MAVDAVVPTVSSVVISGAESDGTTPKTAALVVNDTVLVSVTFNELVNVNTTNGTPRYAIDIGGVTRQADYVSGSGNNILVFRYTIVAGDADSAGGVTTGAIALTFNGGTILDAAGLTAARITPVVAPAANAVVIDTVLPTAASVNPTVGDDLNRGGYGNGDTITLTFSEAINVSNITLAVLNAALSGGKTLGTSGTGAAVAASNEVGGFASTFVITLGSDSTVAANDLITIPQASVVDARGNAAAAGVVFTIPVPLSGPTAASIDPITVSDVDASGSYNAGDTITLAFSASVVIANLTIDQFTVPGKTLGAGATVAAVGGDGTNASSFIITLGTSPTVSAGEQIIVTSASVVDTNARVATNNISFTLTDITPAGVAANNPIIANDVDGSSGFTAGDTLTISFNEAVNIANLTTDATTVFSVAGKTLGTGFVVTAIGGANGLSTQFRITLGTGANIAAADTLVVAREFIRDAANNAPAANLNFAIPDVLLPAAATNNPITVADTDTNDAYGNTDVITLNFNKPIQISSLTLTDFTVALGAKTFGTGATLTAGAESPTGFATAFIITLGTGSTVVQGDQISVSGTNLIDTTGTRGTGNTTFTLPDITPPAALGNALPRDIGPATGVYDAGDTLTINFSEGIQVAAIANTDLGTTINLNNSHVFGTGATIAPTNTVNGLATQFVITLGTGTDVAASDVVTINADQISDLAGNNSVAAQTFTLPAADTTTITSITVPNGNFGSGDPIVVTVNFSEIVNVVLRGGIITLDLVIGDSTVSAQYTGGTGTTGLQFTYSASGAVGNIGVRANAIDLNSATVRNATGQNAELTHAEQNFPGAVVNAPFGVGTAAAVWFDGSDVDGDNDTTDQQVGDIVSEWRDKSGNERHASTPFVFRRPTIQSDANHTNGNQAVRFDFDQLLTAAGQQIGSDTGYTLFGVASGHIGPHGGVFSTRSGENGNILYAVNGQYDAWVRALGTWNAQTAGAIGSGPSIIGDSAIAGGTREIRYNGTATEVASISNITQGNLATLGAVLPNTNFVNGYINEVLYYNRALSDAEQVVVQNYLSSKWGTDLAAGVDFYAGDTAANGDYDLFVTGISNLAGSSVAAGSQGGLTVASSATSGFLQDTGDAVFLGNKGLGVVNTELPGGGVATVRSNTVWYLDATDAATQGGNIDLTFDLDRLGLEVSGNTSDYVLLWRSSLSGQFSEIATADSVNDNSITFAGINIDTAAVDATVRTSTDLIKDGYVTIGVRDNAAPAYESVEVSGNTITLTFDEFLNVAAIPEVSSFSVDVSGARTVTNVAVSGSSVTLTFDGAAVIDANTVSAGYVQPSTGAVLEDVAGNNVASLTNVIAGTSGVNTLVGTAGADIITGNQGDDTLTGGGGSDVFDFNVTSDGNDTITDFVIGAGGDSLDLSDILEYTSADTLGDFLTVTDNGAGNSVTVGVDSNGDGSGADITITLSGIGTGSLSLADFETNNLVVL